MKDQQDWPLYDLWRVASGKGYSLRLEGDYIRLVQIRTQGDYSQARTFARNRDGIKAACAWLDPRLATQTAISAGNQSDKCMTNV